MNFKLLFPSFRNRYVFVQKRLNSLSKGQWFERGLNLGTGEGDYDRMIASHCRQLIGCDVNDDDLAHARRANNDITHLQYAKEDAQSLSYPDGYFDLVVSCEVLEHVCDPLKMVQEIGRVLKPGGSALITFPNRRFPFSYDPINWLWLRARRGKGREYFFHQGAYAFGHDHLIAASDFEKWLITASLEIVELTGLSGLLVGLCEAYWTGIVQRIFKNNSGNVTKESAGILKVRPSTARDPALARFTDTLLWIDRTFFSWGTASVGVAVVLRKKG